jgi:hypothetical protein
MFSQKTQKEMESSIPKFASSRTIPEIPESGSTIRKNSQWQMTC